MTPDEHPSDVEIHPQVDETARQLVNVVNTYVQLTQIDSQRQKCLDEYTHNSLATALRHLQVQLKKYLDWDDDNRRGCILMRHQDMPDTDGLPDKDYISNKTCGVFFKPRQSWIRRDAELHNLLT